MKQSRVEVRPNSRHIKIEQITDSVYKMHLTAPATEGKANEQLIQALAKHFKIAKSLITIKNGKSAKNKVIIIDQ